MKWFFSLFAKVTIYFKLITWLSFPFAALASFLSITLRMEKETANKVNKHIKISAMCRFFGDPIICNKYFINIIKFQMELDSLTSNFVVGSIHEMHVVVWKTKTIDFVAYVCILCCAVSTKHSTRSLDRNAHGHQFCYTNQLSAKYIENNISRCVPKIEIRSCFHLGHLNISQMNEATQQKCDKRSMCVWERGKEKNAKHFPYLKLLNDNAGKSLQN